MLVKMGNPNGSSSITPTMGQLTVNPGNTYANPVSLGFKPSIVELYVSANTTGSVMRVALYDANVDANQYYLSQRNMMLSLPQTDGGGYYATIGDITNDGFTVLGYTGAGTYNLDYIAYP